MIAANRANGRKSQGPVTAEGKVQSRRNAARHWGRAETLRPLMPALGEDPAEFDQLRQGLYRALDPRDDFECLLVDDMAEIHWRLRRMVRAEAAAQATQRREQQAWREEEDAKSDIGRMNELEPFTISQLGLAGLKDSPPKFARILQILRALEMYVTGAGFAGEYIVCLQTVYGPNNPGLRGRHLMSEYKRLCEEDASADAATREANRAGFLKELGAEIAWFEQRAVRDRQARIELQVPRVEAQLLSPRCDPVRLARYHAALERCFETKWRLLMRYRDTAGKVLDLTLESGKASAIDASAADDGNRVAGPVTSTAQPPPDGAERKRELKIARTNPLNTLK